MALNLTTLTIEQLRELDDSLEEFIFKQPSVSEEPFSPTFRKDPKTFRQLIRLMVAFKRDLMKLFTKMYEDRANLVAYHRLPTYVRFDEYDQYFDDYYWQDYDQQLAQVIEKHTKKSYGLGILALLALYGISTQLTAEDAQKTLTKHAIDISTKINQVTKERIKKQIEAALKLNEDRSAFEERLKKIFTNQYRGRLIAENEALQAFNDGQGDVAVDAGYKYKTWTGIQTDRSEICGEVIGETVPINEAYSNGLMSPLAHIRCRCSEEYSNSRD